MLQIHATTFAAARQALAVALVMQKECAIRIDPLLQQHIHYNRTLQAIVAVLHHLHVSCTYHNGIITVSSQKLPACTATIALHSFCPVTDIYLTIAPALSCNSVQSDITFIGVTHCQYTHSTGFVRFGLAPVLSQFGCYTHMATKKFGFYTATGNAVAKIYPQVKRKMGTQSSATRITGIRIYIANIDQEFAFHQKRELCRALALNEDIVGIMQVANVTNHGNAIDVFFSTGDIPSMLSFTMPLYDDNGTFVFEDTMMHEFLHTVINTCLQSYEYIPLPVVEEALPFLLAAGYDVIVAERLHPKIVESEVYTMCKEFRG
ncbi:MAG: RNA 3'-terminal phosphate cyclase [Spirochaetota bacterium]